MLAHELPEHFAKRAAAFELVPTASISVHIIRPCCYSPMLPAHLCPHHLTSPKVPIDPELPVVVLASDGSMASRKWVAALQAGTRALRSPPWSEGSDQG